MPFFIRGDANGDGAVDLSDAISIYSYLQTGTIPGSGVIDALDVEYDGDVDEEDGEYLLTYLFGWEHPCCPGIHLPGPPPPPPFWNEDETALEAGILSVHLAP